MPGEAHIGQQRKQARHRKRRIIFNNDGGDIDRAGAQTREALLELRTSALAGSQVDAICYNAVKLFHGVRWAGRGFRIDPLETMVEFCRGAGIEIFCSFRMNDIHNPSRFHRDHPECLFGTQENEPPYGAWFGVDYSQPLARERAFGEVREICQRYDLDGIELDFFRHPVLFRRHAWGQPLEQAQLDAMTGLLRRIRAMTDLTGTDRARPMLLAVRVPESLGYCRAIGLDLERWLSEDLVDLLVAGGDFPLAPWEHMVELGHEYDVPVHACLNNSWTNGLGAIQSNGEGRHEAKDRNSIESYRGRAAVAWNAGVDGVYLFNFFDPHLSLWREVGDRETLGGLDKDFYANVLGFWGVSRPRLSLKDGERFLRLATLSPDRPEVLETGQTLEIPFAVGENFQGGTAPGSRPQVRLQLLVENLSDVGDVHVALNGTPLSGGILREGLQIEVPCQLIRQGMNEVAMTLAAGMAAPVTIHDLMLSIRYDRVPSIR
ncbi:MAG: hypothetical protein OXH50_00315 [Gemmatimonadetes bacterium]|nr:hypothetical protein [Gemmatimonadota bacterium]